VATMREYYANYRASDKGGEEAASPTTALLSRGALPSPVRYAALIAQMPIKGHLRVASQIPDTHPITHKG
jgi:hypothetical protein